VIKINKRLETTFKWCEEHKGKWPFKPTISHNRENYNRYHRKYRKKSSRNLLTDRIRCLINYSLRRKGIKRHGKCWSLLDYSVEDLKKRLNNTIPKGYT